MDTTPKDFLARFLRFFFGGAATVELIAVCADTDLKRVQKFIFDIGLQQQI